MYINIYIETIETFAVKQKNCMWRESQVMQPLAQKTLSCVNICTSGFKSGLDPDGSVG